LGVVEEPLGAIGGADQDVGRVVGQIQLLEVVLPGSVVEVPEDDHGRVGVGVQALLEMPA
jgi:hypothetical protein